MRFLTQTPQISDVVFVPSFNEEVSFFQQQYDFLNSCYDKLKATQETLEKLGELAVIGCTYTEEKLVNSLKQLKFVLLRKDDEQIKQQLVLVRERLWNYLVWLKENSNNLPTYLLRQDIENSKLTYDDILALAYLLSLTRSNLKEDINKFELLLTELYKRIAPEDFNNLLDYVMPLPESSPLTEQANEKLFYASELINKIRQTGSFYKLVLTNLLSDARTLKQELRQDFWHKDVILAVITLDLELKRQFQKFAIEKATILEICKSMLANNFNAIGELTDGTTLNLAAAKDFIENLDKILAQDYESLQNELKQAAQVFEIVYNANDEWQKLSKQASKINNQKADQQKFVATKAENLMLKPLIETHRNIGIVEIEEQLTARVEEIINSINQTAKTNKLPLRYSQLILSQNEIIALFSQGNMLESTFHAQQYNLTRKVTALIAELQETFSLLSQNEQKSLKSNLNNILGQLLEHAEKVNSELEILSKQADKQSDINLSIALVGIKNKLTKAVEQSCEWSDIILQGSYV